MFIHEMTEPECRHALEQATVGRLACARDNQPYVVPVHFAFDGESLYGFATWGQKIEWMRSNPLVCFEVDEFASDDQWWSIVVFGRYEELTDALEYGAALNLAHDLLQKRAMWWEPAYIAPTQRNHAHSLTPIFYRLHIERMTGHRATSEVSDTPALAPAAKRGWLDKLIHSGT